jgi:hypothetical protein
MKIDLIEAVPGGSKIGSASDDICDMFQMVDSTLSGQTLDVGERYHFFSYLHSWLRSVRIGAKSN